MKTLLTWVGTGLLTSALLDPLIASMLDQPVRWLLDLAMLLAGSGCLYLLVKHRKEL